MNNTTTNNQEINLGGIDLVKQMMLDNDMSFEQALIEVQHQEIRNAKHAVNKEIAIESATDIMNELDLTIEYLVSDDCIYFNVFESVGYDYKQVAIKVILDGELLTQEEVTNILRYAIENDKYCKLHKASGIETQLKTIEEIFGTIHCVQDFGSLFLNDNAELYLDEIKEIKLDGSKMTIITEELDEECNLHYVINLISGDFTVEM